MLENHSAHARIPIEEKTKSLLEKPFDKEKKRTLHWGDRDTWWRLLLRDIDLAPGQYNLLPPEVPKFSAKQFMFRSAVQRCRSTYFTPGDKDPTLPIQAKEGPGPGEYEIKKEVLHPICSSFQSKVPRLLPIRSKIPGPGAYEPTRHFPEQPRTIESLGKEHSIFFSNTLGF
ncbi:hypothetical protein Y1Q_0011058 [Alligator mississippiensis]|uniref:Protein STPG4 n=1 Tax=Alligator mississippiensis TaxID=8496 RepID=A0A151NWG5_ALLMI|nr:hypothetical protein Y1Q_0011058 [Alligator mississippiensis]